jgi:hypothetical protein
LPGEIIAGHAAVAGEGVLTLFCQVPLITPWLSVAGGAGLLGEVSSNCRINKVVAGLIFPALSSVFSRK